jgi:hypothetical protein
VPARTQEGPQADSYISSGLRTLCRRYPIYRTFGGLTIQSPGQKSSHAPSNDESARETATARPRRGASSSSEGPESQGYAKVGNAHRLRDTFAVELLLQRYTNRAGERVAWSSERADHREALFAMGPRAPPTTRALFHVDRLRGFFTGNRFNRLAEHVELGPFERFPSGGA